LDRPAWPERIATGDGSEHPLDARTPSVARVCDAFLGGKDSFGGIARKA
jgi:hypothetical protein